MHTHSQRSSTKIVLVLLLVDLSESDVLHCLAHVHSRTANHRPVLFELPVQNENLFFSCISTNGLTFLMDCLDMIDIKPRAIDSSSKLPKHIHKPVMQNFFFPYNDQVAPARAGTFARSLRTVIVGDIRNFAHLHLRQILGKMQ